MMFIEASLSLEDAIRALCPEAKEERSLCLLLARWRRHNRERGARGYWRDYRERSGVREQRAANQRAYYARRKKYLDELWA
jgi:hypothetical protein